jgi:hypothetical protein
MSSNGISLPPRHDDVPPAREPDEAFDRELTRRLRQHEARDEITSAFAN